MLEYLSELKLSDKNTALLKRIPMINKNLITQLLKLYLARCRDIHSLAFFKCRNAASAASFTERKEHILNIL